MISAKKQRKRIEWERDLFKKIRDTKGTFHAKMGSIKEVLVRNTEVISHHQPEECGKGQKEAPHIRPPP